ncbi:MAG: hypothetical protein MUC35_01825 [Candidatus Margulisbacteria bacterium]|nr:hypothetical protein [Candidatus Margulisiibacteriota bacterium]
MNKVRIVLLFLTLTLAVTQAVAGGGKGRSSAPTYYTLEDLREQLKVQWFDFANASKPPYALVELGAIPIYPASTAKRAAQTRSLLANPSAYRVKASRLNASWIDYDNRTFDWPTFSGNGGLKGDLVFLRSNGIGADVVKIFSNWTHVAIVVDPWGKTVFESTPGTGVNVNYAPSTWSTVSYYTCKRIRPYSSGLVASLVDKGIAAFRGLPYFPKFSTTRGNVTEFTFAWSNKEDLSSMYCSKLVYQTFKNYVSFDTNNTSVTNSLYQERAGGSPAFSWIGVSPDDVYYCADLDHDFCYSPNLRYI